MDPRLDTFLTLCRTMHYGRAAEALNLSQPAVSKHIQALEAQYGAKLFDYSGRRLSRTRAGELLEQYASTLRYNEEKLIAAMHARPETLLRIGATKSIGDYILLPEIRRFLSAPGNRLTFLVDNTARLLSQLEAGELDFAVLDGIFDKARYDSFRVRMEPYIGVCARSHPFGLARPPHRARSPGATRPPAYCPGGGHPGQGDGQRPAPQKGCSCPACPAPQAGGRIKPEANRTIPAPRVWNCAVLAK